MSPKGDSLSLPSLRLCQLGKLSWYLRVPRVSLCDSHLAKSFQLSVFSWGQESWQALRDPRWLP